MAADTFILDDNSGEPPLTLSAAELHAELDRQLSAIEGDIAIDWQITIAPDLCAYDRTIFTQPIPLQ